MGDDNSGSLGLDGLSRLSLDDLDLVGFNNIWLNSHDDFSSLLLNNSLSAGVSVGVGISVSVGMCVGVGVDGGLWNLNDLLLNVSAGLDVLNWLGVENLDGFLNSVACAIRGNLVKLGKIDSQVLVCEFDFSLGLNAELLTSSWLAVNNNGLGGDVGFNGSTWNQFRVLSNESTDFGLGKVKGSLLSLDSHVQGGIHGAGICL